jgi:hypothetical protein
MPQYLVEIHLPDNYDPAVETEAMVRDIDVLNEEMMAAGVRIFGGGLTPGYPEATRTRRGRMFPSERHLWDPDSVI